MIRRWLGGPPAPKDLGIVPYRGYGNARRLWCRGRVLDKRGIVSMRERDTFYDNLHKMYRRFLSRPGAGAVVRARSDGEDVVVQATEEGFFGLELAASSDAAHHRVDVELELVDAPAGQRARATAEVFVPPSSAGLGVISDIDDTILHTNATDRLRMARLVLFGNARTRLPFSGVRAFYRALHDGANGGAGNPFFYLSSSSWHIYDLMRDFMDLHDLPRGPILLRAMRFTRASLFSKARHEHKLDRIEEIFSRFPELPFLLIGDSGQRDAELYREVAERHPGRVPAIYLRDVLPTPRRRLSVEAIADSVSAAGCELLLVDTTLEAARHAAERGWIAESRLPEIERDEIHDEPRNPLATFVTHTFRAIARLTRPRRRRQS